MYAYESQSHMCDTVLSRERMQVYGMYITYVYCNIPCNMWPKSSQPTENDNNKDYVIS